MNTRQKAKYYKRKYEEIIKQPIAFTVEQYKTDTLQFERFYPEAHIRQKDVDILQEIVVNDVARALAEELDKYVEYRSIYDPLDGGYWLFGKVRVVAMK